MHLTLYDASPGYSSQKARRQLSSLANLLEVLAGCYRVKESLLLNLTYNWESLKCNVVYYTAYIRAAVPKLFGTRDQFRGRQFFHEPGRGGKVSG